MTDKRLIYNNPDPSAGGIPRYAYQMKKLNNAEQIDFTEFQQGLNLLEKLWNNIKGREIFLQKQSSNKKVVNHFVQPELYTPKLPGKDLVTIHDLFLFRDDQYNGLLGQGRKYFYKKRLKQAVRHADHFIAVSQQTKKQCLDSLGIEEDSIKVINLGFRDKFIPKQDVQKRNVVGYIGDNRKRKRVSRLLDDWYNSFEYKETRRDVSYKTDCIYELEICGTAGKQDYGEVSERGDINLRGFIEESKIVEWYNSISALFLPSEVEGFGLPILEATACGTPVFVYNDAEITEELEPFVFRVNSIEDVPNKLDGITDEALANNSKQVKEEFSWDTTQNKHDEVYKRLT